MVRVVNFLVTVSLLLSSFVGGFKSEGDVNEVGSVQTLPGSEKQKSNSAGYTTPNQELEHSTLETVDLNPVPTDAESIVTASISSTPTPPGLAETPRRSGLVNHASICYMNSLLTSLFASHWIRNAFYHAKPERMMVPITAAVFARLQTNNGVPVTTAKNFMTCAEKAFGWEFAGFHCILEFWSLLIDSLSDDIKSLFKVEYEKSFYIKDSDQLLKKASETELDHLVSLIYTSIQEAVDRDFLDVETTDFSIEPEDWKEYEHVLPEQITEKVKFTVYDKIKITNRPPVLVFGLKRLVTSWNQAVGGISYVFNDTPLEVNERLLLKGESDDSSEYVLHAFACHNTKYKHYVSYVCDYTEGNPEGSWYEYDDTTVTAVDTEEKLELMWQVSRVAATLAVYVRRDCVAMSREQVPVVPERYEKLASMLKKLDVHLYGGYDVNRGARGVEASMHGTQFNHTASDAAPPRSKTPDWMQRAKKGYFVACDSKQASIDLENRNKRKPDGEQRSEGGTRGSYGELSYGMYNPSAFKPSLRHLGPVARNTDSSPDSLSSAIRQWKQYARDNPSNSSEWPQVYDINPSSESESHPSTQDGRYQNRQPERGG